MGRQKWEDKNGKTKMGRKNGNILKKLNKI
jgi:hypothetical protein